MAVGKRKTSVKRRMFTATVVFIFLLGLLTLRTGYWQFVKGEWLKNQALEQQTREKDINPRRGTIYDRNGKELAVSANVETVVASPDIIKKEGNADIIAEVLSPIIDMSKEEIKEKITKNSRFEYVKKRVESDKANKIRNLLDGLDENGNELSDADKKKFNINGISLQEDTKRYYPFGDFLSQIIGFTGADNQGLEGLEMAYDKYLKGQKGKIVKTGTTGGDLPFDYEKYYSAQDGNNLVLTIDEVIQHFVEKHLDEAYVENNAAKGACAMVMDPKTGEILAMASRPSFDPNDPFTVKDTLQVKMLQGIADAEKKQKEDQLIRDAWRNKPVVEVYEPGSTFKMMTCAIGLENNVVSLDDTFTCNGSLQVGGHNIHCWKTAGHGTQTFLKGMVNSCNPVLMQVGARIGKDTFYRSMKLFGFRETLGFDMPGEALGQFFDYNSFGDVDLATSSFGQGISITPLQLVTAASAMVNGGYLMRPHIVKKITDAQGNTVQEVAPQQIRQIISRQTSDKMRYVLETVIKESGSTAAVKGYRIGGKSGTSQKRPLSSGKYIASFVAFAPVDDPKFVVFMMIDEPQGANYYGGVIAAPAVGAITEEILRYYGIEPQYSEEELKNIDTTVPDVRGMSVEQAKKALTGFRLGAKVVGNGSTIAKQSPDPFVKIMENSTIILYTEGADQQQSTVAVPDLTGKTLTEANSALAAAGLNIKVSGNTQGSADHPPVVYKQDPAPGSTVPSGSVVNVEFRPVSVTDF